MASLGRKPQEGGPRPRGVCQRANPGSGRRILTHPGPHSYHASYDRDVGHLAPGSLRLDGPFDRRLVHWNIAPVAGRATRLRCWVRSEALAGCLATLNVAAFAADHWIDTWCLASTDPSGNAANGWRMVDRPAEIPGGTSAWALVEATLPAEALPPETDHVAFFIDARQGDGKLWIDELDLWQPDPS